MTDGRNSSATTAAREGVEILELAPMLRVIAELPDPGPLVHIDLTVAVPFSLDESGRWTLAEHHPDSRRSYTCPFCRDPVKLRQSERAIRTRSGEMLRRTKVRPHWIYRRETCFVAQSQLRRRGKPRRSHECETALHQRIKRVIALEIEAWKSGIHQPPRLEYLCCDHHCEQPTKVVDLDGHVVAAIEEHRLNCGRVVDVALQDASGATVLGVEVLVTHGVDDQKRVVLDVPWIELDALGYQPGHWRVRQSSETAELCRTCKERIEASLIWWSGYADGLELRRFVHDQTTLRLANLARSQELTEQDQLRVQAEVMREYEIEQRPDVKHLRVAEVAEHLGLKIPAKYTGHRWYCQTCLEPMLVFSWVGRGEGRNPPLPHPPGLHPRSDGQWLQYCPSCCMVQHVRWRSQKDSTSNEDVTHGVM